MKLLTANRANKILFNFLKVNNISGNVLLPANILGIGRDKAQQQRCRQCIYSLHSHHFLKASLRCFTFSARPGILPSFF